MGEGERGSRRMTKVKEKWVNGKGRNGKCKWLLRWTNVVRLIFMQ
jgi:hypothetical protein